MNTYIRHNMSDIECPVCCESIISPYGLPCGHTICACCFSQLKEDKCPICRGPFRQKDKFEPNILLENFLMEKNPNYLELKEKKDRFIKINRFTALYNKSIYFHDIKKALIKFIHDNNYYVSLSMLFNVFCFAQNICEIELRYIVDQMKYLAAVELDGEWYIVDCSSWEYLDKFVTDNRTFLLEHKELFYHLLIIDGGETLINLVQLCGLDPMLYTKQKLSKPDSEPYMTWVISHKDKNLPKYVRADDDSDSDYSDYSD